MLRKDKFSYNNRIALTESLASFYNPNYNNPQLNLGEPNIDYFKETPKSDVPFELLLLAAPVKIQNFLDKL